MYACIKIPKTHFQNPLIEHASPATHITAILIQCNHKYKKEAMPYATVLSHF